MKTYFSRIARYWISVWKPIKYESVEELTGNADALESLEKTVIEKLQAGEKIKAIIYVRELSGAKLPPAKKYVDSVEQQLVKA